MNKKGYTLVEVLIVIFIISILMMAAIVNYRSFQRGLELTSSTNDVIAALQLAQERTLSSKNDDQYGVHFETDFYAIFKGSDWNASDPDNEVVYFPSNVEYTDAWEGTTTTILFNRITGTTSSTNDVILRLSDDHDQSRTIKVLASGRVGLAGTIDLEDTRIVDSRHVHFDLGWSLQGASELELVFHDPPEADVEEDIDMSNYFNPGETEFDWEGTVDVNGEAQTLRVHTHSLDAFNTLLCIHRDGRENTKAVDVSVDGKAVASFSADGTPTVGIFGGTMEIQ